MAIAVNGSRPASYIWTCCRQQGQFQPAGGSHQCQRWDESDQYEPVGLHLSILSNRLNVQQIQLRIGFSNWQPFSCASQWSVGLFYTFRKVWILLNPLCFCIGTYFPTHAKERYPNAKWPFHSSPLQIFCKDWCTLLIGVPWHTWCSLFFSWGLLGQVLGPCVGLAKVKWQKISNW